MAVKPEEQREELVQVYSDMFSFVLLKLNIAISSMMRLVSYDSLPGIDTQSMGFMGTLRMPLHLCTSSSTKSTSWIAPLRKILLENYISMQHALAKFVS